jgi:hypothetical protein
MSQTWRREFHFGLTAETPAMRRDWKCMVDGFV